jgi:hypothetical protein
MPCQPHGGRIQIGAGHARSLTAKSGVSDFIKENCPPRKCLYRSYSSIIVDQGHHNRDTELRKHRLFLTILWTVSKPCITDPV